MSLQWIVPIYETKKLKLIRNVEYCTIMHINVGSPCTSPKYLRNSFIPATVTQSTEQFMQKILQRGQTFRNSAFNFAGYKSNHITHPKGSTDKSCTKWFIENQDTAYWLGKLHIMVICCLLTNKISILIPNARLLLNSFF